ncbi:MAG: hypothetical protein KF910_03710 [Brevundimonas sp.]|uniref:hypothetical protein n=1 Tax=Brevundimonas sp. TaxID=1871086 RepID=UPI0025BBD3E8|nr:hypothetical protein [Brevundimonas sp.]MBX3476686.1 hypothetical protein [Brevundimonas sp.]
MPPADEDVSLQDLDRAPVSLEPVESPAAPGDVEKLRDRFTEVTEENVALKQEVDELKKRVRTAEILDALIAPYAERAFAFMCAYSSAVGFILLLSGSETTRFNLDTEVLVLLVGSTAVTVIGLVGMVLTGIFVGARKRQ